MILNSGLDNACTESAQSQGGSLPAFARFVRYAAFGTGSTTPAVTDTTLDAQVGDRTDSQGGFSDVTNGGTDAGTGTIWYESTFTRVFNITSNVNATEWGLAPATVGSLSVRDLFRADPNDPMSSPITLTLEDGDQLQLVITLRVEANWGYEAKSFVITGTAGNDTNGTHTGQASIAAGASPGVSDIGSALQSAWPGGGGGASPSILNVWTSSQATRAVTDNAGAIPSANASMSNEPYTPGDYFRDCTAQFSTAEANGTHYAWCCSMSGANNVTATFRGLRFLLSDPGTLTKAGTHRLTLTVRKSIARL